MKCVHSWRWLPCEDLDIPSEELKCINCEITAIDYIKTLESKLKIAVDALKTYADENNYDICLEGTHNYNFSYGPAQEALKQIDEVDNGK